MNILGIFLKTIDTLGKWAGALSVVLISGIAILVVTEVFARWALGISLSFSWEYSAYFMGVSIFCSAAYTMRTGGHVKVALFRGFFGPSGQRVLDTLASLIGFGITSFIAYSLVAFAWRSFERGTVSATIDATPLAIPQGMIALGATILALQMLARTIRLITGEPEEDMGAKENFSVE